MHNLDVRAMMKSVDEKVKLSDDAVELIDAYLVSLFGTIATKANKIVGRACKDGLSGDDVKKAVKQVFNQTKK